jgi:hypothetical protein
MMENKLITICMFVMLAHIAMSLTYQTNSTRTDAVNNLCAKYPSRAALVNSQDEATVAQYNAMMKLSFP